MNWDDLRVILAIERGRTLSEAARRLGVNQTTVSRRLGRLEAWLGVPLFERVDHQLRRTAECERVISQIEGMEESARALEHQLRHSSELLAGSVRLTSVPSFINAFIAPALATFHRESPGICLELVGTSRDLNLSRRDADLALRFTRPEQGKLVIRKLADIGYAAYASPDLAREPLPLAQYPWIGYDDDLRHLPEARWLHQQLAPARITATGTESLTMATLAAAGLGAAVLPCYIGDADPRLSRLGGEQPLLHRELWLVYHPDNRYRHRIRRVAHWLTELVQDRRALLHGALNPPAQ